MKTKYLILLCTFAVSSSFATVTTGAYLGIELGGANQNIDYNSSAFKTNTFGTTMFDNSWTGIGRLFGGYNFNRYNALEAGFSQSLSSTFSTPTANNFSSTSSIFDISYLPMLPISNSNWSVFGRLGVGYVWLPGGQVGCNCNGGQQFDASGSNFADVLGAGLRYKFANNWTYKIEWIADGLLFPVGISGNNNSLGSWDQQTFQTGVAFHF